MWILRRPSTSTSWFEAVTLILQHVFGVKLLSNRGRTHRIVRHTRAKMLTAGVNRGDSGWGDWTHFLEIKSNNPPPRCWRIMETSVAGNEELAPQIVWGKHDVV